MFASYTSPARLPHTVPRVKFSPQLVAAHQGFECLANLPHMPSYPSRLTCSRVPDGHLQSDKQLDRFAEVSLACGCSCSPPPGDEPALFDVQRSARAVCVVARGQRSSRTPPASFSGGSGGKRGLVAAARLSSEPRIQET